MFLKKWWCSLLLLPFMWYTLHQAYWALRYNIYFMVNYDFPFPVNVVYFLTRNFLLIVHEAGHTFFSIFDIRFITILGGSLFQILLPLGILAYTWINRKKNGIQLALFLVGLSWLDVAGYAADGGQQQLPLIGGLSSESHDWMNLLSDLGMLDRDLQVGIAFAIIGVICYLLALLVPALMREYRQVKLDLEL
ncbi:MAG: hypothetical protein R3224_09050 [Balneolaceae bacterium]|nr:hypothetical protein [Balneolaceae bacterium]